jgi:hypothetical protein
MVIRRCRRLLGSDDETRDAAQDVFMRLVEYRSRLRPEYPSSLLYRIDNIRNVDVGADIGASIRFPTAQGAWTIDALWSLGVRDLSDDAAPVLKSRALLLLLGRRFR